MSKNNYYYKNSDKAKQYQREYYLLNKNKILKYEKDKYNKNDKKKYNRDYYYSKKYNMTIKDLYVLQNKIKKIIELAHIKYNITCDDDLYFIPILTADDF